MNDVGTGSDEFIALPHHRDFQGIYAPPPGQKGSWAQLPFVLGENLESHQQYLLPSSIKRLCWYTGCGCSKQMCPWKSVHGEQAGWLAVFLWLNFSHFQLLFGIQLPCQSSNYTSPCLAKHVCIHVHIYIFVNMNIYICIQMCTYTLDT